jgi:hypothetical protein
MCPDVLEKRTVAAIYLKTYVVYSSETSLRIEQYERSPLWKSRIVYSANSCKAGRKCTNARTLSSALFQVSAAV